MPRLRLELADVFRAHGEAYRQSHVLSPAQARVMRAIETCRTAVLGGHMDECVSCNFERPAYNSCLMESAPFWGARVAFSLSTRDIRSIRRTIHSP